jgi:hypothetical protein
VVGAYAQVGWAALKAGIKNVEAYTARFGFEGTEMRKIEEAANGRQVPPEPAYPGDWTSAAEKRAIWERMQKDAERRQRLAPFDLKVREARAAIEQAEQRFEERGFIKPYKRYRRQLINRILFELRRTKNKGDSGLSVTRWWDCFMSDVTNPDFDDSTGMYMYTPTSTVDNEQAEREIGDFKRLGVPCPYFDEFYVNELQKYLAKNKTALDQAETNLAKAQAE